MFDRILGEKIAHYLEFLKKILKNFQQEIKKMGGDIKDAEKVTKIIPGHQQVTVETSNGHKFAAKSIVLCLGSWAGKFLNEHLGLKLPLKVC